MIRVVDLDLNVVEACKDVGLDAVQGNILEYKGVLVSPANSYGMMDGGVDQAYINKYPQLQEKVFNYIRTEGEIPVGQAVLFFLNMELHPHIILAPTMRTPRKLRFEDLHPYLATRAAYKLYLKSSHFRKDEIDLLFPGMGTGIGMIHPKMAAHQMKMALEDFEMEHPCWECIKEREEKLGILDWS